MVFPMTDMFQKFGLGVAALLTTLSLLSGCAHFTVNQSRPDANPPVSLNKPDRASDLLVVAAFSGGGSRASALALGALEAMANLKINWHGRQRRLIDEIDLVSSVSGGSFTAAWFGLHGGAALDEFRDRFLYRDIESDLVKKIINPLNWARLWSPYYDRSELAKDHYDDILFNKATFADLRRRQGPEILINATDMTLGDSFTFDAPHFDLLCADLDSFPLSRAVAASSAVPGIFSPVTLFNYAGGCGYQTPAWVGSVLAANDDEDERLPLARKIAAYQNILERPYIHLLDGGLADNLGLRAIIDRVRFHHRVGFADPSRLLNDEIARILVIVVNASAMPDVRLNQRKNPPPVIDTVDIATTIQVNRYNADTLKLFREAVERWREAMRVARCGAEHCDAEPEFYFVNAGLQHLKDEKERRFLRLQPTTFSLTRDAVDRLIAAGKKLVLESPDIRAFLDSVQ
ncbi:MAG TPA: hypothetical protein ENK26_03270 [Gammaproteobacteria bacterium]|nr:hypothetical protein [Gammaproteobacteria bacterium]